MEISPRPQSINEALDWHTAIVDSIFSHRGTVLGGFHAGSLGGTRFFGKTYDEIDAFFMAEQEEVDGWALVNIVAAAEAGIRIDYFDRVQQKYKDLLSQSYRSFHSGLSTLSRVRPPFNKGGILDQMKASGVMQAHILGNFRDALRHRHWLAHGRYWALKTSGAILSPMDAHAACKSLLDSLPS